MAHEQDRHAPGLPFGIVRRGYDRDEVQHYFDRFETELRLTATDRDAAATQARNLANQLEDARDQIASLQDDVDRLSVAPTTAEGMSDRISRMLRLASDEASEVRARAQSEAAEVVSIAEQDATAMRASCEAQLAEIQEKRSALEIEYDQTLASARTEAARIIEAAQSEASRLSAESEARRKAVQHDFEVTIAERRTSLTRALEDLETTTKAEARQRVKDATEEAQRIVETANHQADRRIAYSKELAEELRVLRGRVLAQLLGIRGQLDSVPAMLASVNREAELLDSGPAQRSLGGELAALSAAADADIEILDAAELTTSEAEAGADDEIEVEGEVDEEPTTRANGRASAQSGR
jgi:cell division septum initiation protein DivIVA